jgi:hypothetical protein
MNRRSFLRSVAAFAGAALAPALVLVPKPVRDAVNARIMSWRRGTAAEPISAGQFVYIDSNGQLRPASTSHVPAGIAMKNMKRGDKSEVAVSGVITFPR